MPEDERKARQQMQQPNSPFDASAVCAFHVVFTGEFFEQQRAASIPR